MVKLRSRELIPDERIVLYTLGTSDPKRFTTTFRATWRRLPPDVRKTLGLNWSVFGAEVYLTPVWLNRGSILAKCDHFGRLFRFWSPVVDRLPDELLQVYIVHELAHAYCFAMMEPNHVNSPLPESVRRENAEEIVYGLSDSWGFLSRDLARWCVVEAEWLENQSSPASVDA